MTVKMVRRPNSEQNSEALKRQIVVQHNREELVRNVNHFLKEVKNKDLKIDPAEIREMINEHVFKGGKTIVMPDVRM